MTQAAAPGHAVPPDPTTGRPRLVVTSAIGTAQILAWGSSYYLTAVLAGPVAKDTGWPLSWIVGDLSLGLLIRSTAPLCVGDHNDDAQVHRPRRASPH
jgi:hypothetical protein